MQPIPDPVPRDNYYEDLLEFLLKKKLEQQRIVDYERTVPDSVADTQEKTDFIIHFDESSAPLKLQVKGVAWRNWSDAEYRRKYLGYLVETGVKLIRMDRPATVDHTWAMIWYLQNTLDIMAMPGEDPWSETLAGLKNLESRGVVRHYEPVALGSWDVVIKSGETVHLYFPAGTRLSQVIARLAPKVGTKRKRFTRVTRR